MVAVDPSSRPTVKARPLSRSAEHDSELVRKVARGNRQAFATLYDRHGGILFGIVLRILRHREEAEDVLQEIFLQIWQRAEAFDESRGQALPWLTLVARSRALDRLRARAVREHAASASVTEPEPAAREGEDEAIASEDTVTVRRALEAISEDQRTALTLAYFEGLSQSEIAARLDKPLGTVKTHMRLGLMKLRYLLNEGGANR